MVHGDRRKPSYRLYLCKRVQTAPPEGPFRRSLASRLDDRKLEERLAVQDVGSQPNRGVRSDRSTIVGLNVLCQYCIQLDRAPPPVLPLNLPATRSDTSSVLQVERRPGQSDSRSNSVLRKPCLYELKEEQTSISGLTLFFRNFFAIHDRISRKALTLALIEEEQAPLTHNTVIVATRLEAILCPLKQFKFAQAVFNTLVC